MKRLKRWRAVIVINKIKKEKRFLTKEEGEDYIQRMVIDIKQPLKEVDIKNKYNI
jgi:hypothetical protein